jgi:glycosyltransferase involved in cell wall biosynthesis
MVSICFIGDRNIYMKRICNYLADENYNIHLVCRHDQGIRADEFDKRITIYTLQSNRLVKKILAINSYLKKSNPDFVHFQYLTKDILLAWFIHRRYRIIATPWGSDLNIFSNKVLNRLIIHIGLLHCKKIQIISESIKIKLTERFRFINPARLYAISWGIDYERFHEINENKLKYWRERLNITEGDIIILSYRNHKPLYNHQTLIKSLPSLSEQFPTLKCFFTRGNYDPDYLDSSKKLVRQLGLQKNVEFIEEWIPDDLLPALINLAHIVVSIPFSDGLPATILEIMATRAIPVVGNLPEYSSFYKSGENGYILNRLDDSEQLAEILSDCIKKLPEITERFSSRNNKYIWEKQNWNLLKNKMKELYDK